jgi:hypothetical protein
MLGTCRIYGDVEMEECLAKQILELEPEDVTGYKLLSNMYAPAGNNHLCEVVESQKARGVKEQPGYT